MSYVESGVSARIPFRKTHKSVADLNKEINKWRRFSNVYHSIYLFRKSESKYDYLTGKTYRGPNYESAIINKVVLDIDAFQKTIWEGRSIEYYTEKAIEDIRKLANWGHDKKICREYRFSGGGFYFIFKASGHPLKLRDFEINLQNTLDISIDESTIGDTSRMARVTNSFNFKDNRRCYCISLKEEELDWNYEDIHDLASKPRKERFVYGEKTHDFSGCKIDKEKIRLKKLKINLKNIKKSDANDILFKYGWHIDDFCDCIKGILSRDHVGNFLRWEVIKYLKSVVKVSFSDCVKLMVALLGAEGIHSATEKQARYAYQGDKYFNPQWKLKPLGYCPEDCHLCTDLQQIVWKAIKNGR